MKKTNRHRCVESILVAGLFLLLNGCINNSKLGVYQKEVPIPNYEWSYDFQPNFSFKIKDTSARYNISITLRHTNEYPYSNLWVLVHSAFQGERPTSKRVELPLADQMGEWLGSGMDDIYEHRIPIQQRAIFDTAGTYHFSIEQNMRINPLPHVMAVGLRIEKASP